MQKSAGTEKGTDLFAGNKSVPFTHVPFTQEVGLWIKKHPRDAAQVLGPLWGNLDVEAVEAASAHRSYQVQPVKADQLDEQQKIADAFFAAGLLPKAVDAHDVEAWKP